MTNTGTITGICLHGLPAREEAVVKRVISFSGTQGRNYTLSTMDDADILVVSDETEVDFSEMNPAGCMIIRIADHATTQAYDVLMQRPLLVTKVMRTLDEANVLLKAAQQEMPISPSTSATSIESTSAVPKPNTQGQLQARVTPLASTNETAPPAAIQAETPAEPALAREQVAGEVPLPSAPTLESGVPRQQKSATSLYAQIMGNSNVVKTASETVTVTQTTQAAVEKRSEAQQSSAGGVSASHAVEPQPHDQAVENVAADEVSVPSVGHAVEQQDQIVQNAADEVGVLYASTSSEVQQSADDEKVSGTEAAVSHQPEPAQQQQDAIDQPTVDSGSTVTEEALAESSPQAAIVTDGDSAVPAEQKAVDVPADATKPPVAADQSKYHHFALVVDDSLAIRKQLELELRNAGIGADFAETGEEALEKVANNSYDLVFLDIIMPGIDGYETCRQMRIRSDMKKTPIIMLSAKTSPLDEVQGVIAGASTYLTKPVKSEQLQKTLKRVSMWLDNFQVVV